jgi:hypothetical protein
MMVGWGEDLLVTAVCDRRRAEEILNLDALDPPNKRARVISKAARSSGCTTGWAPPDCCPPADRPHVSRIAGVPHDRKPSARTPRLEVCPVTGRARLSHRHAAELFERATAQVDHKGAGWT